ncbi:hypothetical protein SAY86_030068 [Trapa natans]|uniref:AP2/ERF domain-containing protein n=1 Tax=Trapa natans TaxID=22666 RepID=A0AAN7M4F6_TRANT|nr:hypothetical protein SAY86_030068 [Trapa natans]
MKRSPPTSSSCSSSSSSSCAAAGQCDHQQDKNPSSKRSRKSQIHNTNTPNSGTCRRSSIYRGVTRHRWTGRFEAHLWDKSSWNSIQNKKGRQVYLGAYDSEDAAARTYDLAALKYWGPDTTLNFSIDEYKKEMEEMQKLSKEEYLASLRRCSSGFSRGVSKYRGVARHHHNGRWEARIGRVLGNKYLYLGTYNTQEEAAAAYDMAAIQYRGTNAVTNFGISNYIDRLEKKGIHIDLPRHIQPLQKVATEYEPDEVVHVDVDVDGAMKTEVDHAAAVVARDHHEMKGGRQDAHAAGASLYTEFSTMMMMMDQGDGDQDHPWNFYMDVEGPYPSLRVSDLPLEKYIDELPDVLGDCRGFDDNIHLIFEAGGTEVEVPVETDRMSLLGGFERGGGMSPSSTTSSPTSSTTTLVSGSYIVIEE